MEEIWKDIYFVDNGIEYDYRGLYQVSNFGRIKSLNYRRSGEEKILKLNKNKRKDSGKYDLLVYLCKNGNKKKINVARITAHMFLSDSFFDSAEINHKDENPENNCIENLEWCTIEYNNNYGTKNKRQSDKMKIITKERYKNKNNRLYGKDLNYSQEIVAINLKTNESFIFFGSGETKREIFKIFNINIDESTILKICKYNHDKEEYRKKHKIVNKTNKGFTFYYKNDFKEELNNGKK